MKRTTLILGMVFTMFFGGLFLGNAVEVGARVAPGEGGGAAPKCNCQETQTGLKGLKTTTGCNTSANCWYDI